MSTKLSTLLMNGPKGHDQFFSNMYWGTTNMTKNGQLLPSDFYIYKYVDTVEEYSTRHKTTQM